MNLNMYNWMIDTDFFWHVLRILGAVLLALTIMVLYVYLKLRQENLELDEKINTTLELTEEARERILSGKSVRKEP